MADTHLLIEWVEDEIEKDFFYRAEIDTFKNYVAKADMQFGFVSSDQVDLMETTYYGVASKYNLIEKIQKRGNKWVVLDSSGEKVLGTHETKEKAKKQLAAIEISKQKG